MANQKFGNNLKNQLALSTTPGSLAPSATTVTLTAGGGNLWPSPTAGDYILATLYEINAGGAEVNHEVVKITTKTGDAFTIATRDFENDNSGVGRSFPSVVGTNPTGAVYMALRYTAYAANNTLNKDDNLASLSNITSAKTTLGVNNVDNTSDATKNAAVATLTNKTINLTTNTLVATSAQLLAAVTDETGSGSLVFSNTPTLTTPNIGVATATTVNKVTITAPATSASLTLAQGSTLATAGAFSTTLTATAATNVTLPTTGTLSTLAGAETLTNKTLTAPVLTTPALGVATATSINKVALTQPVTAATLTLADNSTLATAGAFSTTLTSTAATNVTLPTTGTLSTLAGTETLTNKTISAATNTITTAASGNLVATSLNAALAELQTDIDTRQVSSAKDATGGYVGLTLFKINFKNALNTITSFFTNANTVARTYTFQDRDGIIADDTDLAAKANLASPTFTGTPSLPTGTVGVTQAAGTSTTTLATTAFVTAADNLKANLASPTFTGTPSLPTGTVGVTQVAGTNTTALATTAFVTAADNLKANIDSQAFTGTPSLPTGTTAVTQTAGDNSTKLATTAYVATAVSANAGGMTLLGTLTTTSGASQSLAGLNLTGYKQIRAVLNDVSGNSTLIITIGGNGINQATPATSRISGFVDIDLANGVGVSNIGAASNVALTSVANTIGAVFASGLSTASTSITFTAGGGSTAFDLGSIVVYGVK